MTTPTDPTRTHADYPITQSYVLPGPIPPIWNQPPPEPKRKSWPARHKVWTAILAVVGLFIVLGIVGAIVGPAPQPVTPAAPVASSAIDTDGRGTPGPAPTKAPTAPAVTAKPKPPPPAAPVLTAGQEQAVGAAKDYLALSGFSRAGLIKQLSSQYGEGFSKANATFAVDYLHVNWKAQAVRSAKDYLAMDHFSRSGLIQQLSSVYGDGYTKAEATYAAGQVGL